LHLVDHLISQLDNNNVPINIYIDLSKAFDTLNHNILLEKLRYYGINGISNTLIRSYLSGREQLVKFNNIESNRTQITTGVPQGSVMGPLLCIIYINDLPNSSDILKMLMYADDTTIYFNLNDINKDRAETIINNELTKISDWLAVNKLSLNMSKTKCMMFQTKRKQVRKPLIVMNGTIIDNVGSFNFLGLRLNHNLTWNNDIEVISVMMNNNIGILYNM
jgi:retron-type reverse transcriptase